MGAGVYSRLVEAHRLAAQLEAKIDVITQHSPVELSSPPPARALFVSFPSHHSPPSHLKPESWQNAQ